MTDGSTAHGEVGRARPAADLSGWRVVRSPVRLALMLLAGTAAGVAVGLQAAWPFAVLVGWDVAALIFSAWTWLMMSSMNSSATAAHATREEPGRAQTDLLVLLAAVASLLAVGYVLVQASSAKGSSQDLLAGLGVVSVALSWFAVHTLFSLRYARLYYAGQPGGIDFKQKSPPPRYLDFAYVAFTIGMTFQVSDTDLETPAIRTTALRQALLAYLFGAVILAATINLISGLASSSGGG
jgi:uncharacterized membrane protein